MAYRAASIANEFLDLSDQAGRRITQIEIQKLVYFAHGWNLALKDQPLIGELIEAWQYGPVVRTLYDAFKRFGSDPITAKALSWRMTAEGKFACDTPSIQSEVPAEDVYARALVRNVWLKYGSLAPFKLVEITHLPDSPWRHAYSESKTYIPNESIQTYFKSLMMQGHNG
jgi:uncharacterized phage-associated protein